MSIDELLENRHTTYLKWAEPWPACGPEGNELDAHVEMRATVHDCINLMRISYKEKDLPIMGNDGDLLYGFMTVHWANEVE